MRHHYTPIRMSKCNHSDDSKCWHRLWTNKSLIRCRWDLKMAHGHSGNQSGNFLRSKHAITNHFSHWTPVQRNEELHTSTCSRFIGNSTKLETTMLSFSRWMVKVYRILLSNRTQWGGWISRGAAGWRKPTLGYIWGCIGFPLYNILEIIKL